MKWIGQHIWDFVSRFRNDVYLETLTENFDEFTVVIGNDNKLYKSTTPSEKSRIQVRNDEGSTIPAGAPLYSKGEIGGSERIKVGICVSSDPAKMPCIGVAEFEMNTSDTKDSFAITQGVYNTNIHGFTGLSVGDTLYVNGGVAPHLTQTKPTNRDLIQNVGIVLKTNGTICQGLLVSAIGRTNDVPWPLYVDHATQRVSIGTSSPTVPFHVVGDARIQGNLTVNGTYTQIDTDVNTTEQWLVTNDGTGPAAVINQIGTEDIFDVQDDGTSVFYIEDGGYIGMGTTSPSASLHIAADTPVIRLQDNTSSDNHYLNGNNGEFRIQTTGFLTLRPGNTESVRFLANGNVGIGTTNPISALDVNGTISLSGSAENKLYNASTSPANGTSTNTTVLYGRQIDLYALDDIVLRTGTSSNDDIIFFAGNSEKARILGSGNVGIGTTSPGHKLSISGGNAQISHTEPTLFFNDTTTGHDDWKIYADWDKFYIQQYVNDSSYTTRLMSDATGNIGIGTTSPSEKLEVDGNIAVSGSVQRQISTTHHTFTFGAAGSAAQDYWVPFIGNSELAAPNVTHRTIAPYAGVLKKAIVHSTIAYGTSAQVRFHRIDNGTASVFVNDNSTDDVTTNVTADMSTAYSSVAFDFTTGNTFSAGDQIGVSFVRNNTGLGDVAITLVWEYELF